MSRAKGSKNKATIIREKIEEKKKLYTKYSQMKQMEDWISDVGYIDEDIAKAFGWNIYRVWISNLRKKGYKIETIHGKGAYRLINKTEVEDPVVIDNKPEEKIEVKLYTDEEEVIIEAPETMRSVKTNFKDAILNHLKEYGRINAFDALDLYGCRCLNNVIYSLRKNGYKIVKTKTRTIKQQNTKVDRASSVCEFILSSEPVVEEEKPVKYMVVSIVSGQVLNLGIFDDRYSAKEGLDQAKTLYVNAFNNSASKGCVYLIENDAIIEVKKGFFKEKRGVYTTFSIVEV